MFPLSVISCHSSTFVRGLSFFLASSASPSLCPLFPSSRPSIPFVASSSHPPSSLSSHPLSLAPRLPSSPSPCSLFPSIFFNLLQSSSSHPPSSLPSRPPFPSSPSPFLRLRIKLLPWGFTRCCADYSAYMWISGRPLRISTKACGFLKSSADLSHAVRIIGSFCGLISPFSAANRLNQKPKARNSNVS